MTPSATGKNLDVRVTLQHLKVSPTWRGPNKAPVTKLNLFLKVKNDNRSKLSNLSNWKEEA